MIGVLCCLGDNRKWDIPLIPFIPYPTCQRSDQPLPDTRLRGLRPGQRVQLGVPMAEPDTGVPVPILAVTIHPQTGLVYPLGGMYVCPITCLPQPIQIGCPMLDSRTGKLVLTVGVGLDPVTGQHGGGGGVAGWSNLRRRSDALRVLVSIVQELWCQLVEFSWPSASLSP